MLSWPSSCRCSISTASRSTCVAVVSSVLLPACSSLELSSCSMRSRVASSIRYDFVVIMIRSSFRFVYEDTTAGLRPFKLADKAAPCIPICIDRHDHRCPNVSLHLCDVRALCEDDQAFALRSNTGEEQAP